METTVFWQQIFPNSVGPVCEIQTLTTDASFMASCLLSTLTTFWITAKH